MRNNIIADSTIFLDGGQSVVNVDRRQKHHRHHRKKYH